MCSWRHSCNYQQHTLRELHIYALCCVYVYLFETFRYMKPLIACIFLRHWAYIEWCYMFR